ncbi:hypothetical protein [Labilithrix luteola]|uniref:hypothetical protein n=1 Tax=Labilithrix luteola TaxID=1391654 RepID=UPI0011BA53C8|nr:hypothetical protein [Labilithrix luteola]
MSIDVRVERREGVSRGTVTLSVGGERAERQASSVSCERVLAALAVMASIGLDEREMPANEAPAVAPPASAEPPSPATEARADTTLHPPLARRPKTSSAPARSSQPRAPSRIAVAFGTGLELSLNRATVVSPKIFVELLFPLRFEPFVRLGFERSFRADVASNEGVASVRWNAATVDVCADFVGFAKMAAGGCANVEIGSLDAVVVDPLPSRERSRFWLTGGLSARLSWRPLRALSFDLAVGARVPFLRNELFFEPSTLVYEAPAVVPFAGTAIVGHFP